MQLRSPNFGNTRTLDVQTIVRKNMGDELIVAFDPSWPKLEGFRMTISALKTQQKDDAIAFFIQMQGQIIQFTDFRSQVWEGLVGERVEIIDRMGDGCSFEISFSFEGHAF